MKTIIAYSATLAAIALGLQYIQYRHQVRMLPTEWYVVVVAILFSVLGVWAGRRLTARNRADAFQRNQQAMAYLGITEREIEVLEHLADGLSNRQMARKLFVSENTIKSHLKSIYAKLDVSRRTEAVKKAREFRLMP